MKIKQPMKAGSYFGNYHDPQLGDGISGKAQNRNQWKPRALNLDLTQLLRL